MRTTNKYILLWCLLILLFLPLSFYVGYRYGHKKAAKKQTKKVKIPSILPSQKIKKETGKAVVSKKIKQIPGRERITEKEEQKKESQLYILSCKDASQDIIDFLSYLNKKDYLKKYTKEKAIEVWISSIVKKLSQNPPNPEGEGIKSTIMISNIYHFFRILSINEIEMIKEIIKNESDQLEYLLRWYYLCLICQNKCPDPYRIFPSIKTAYTYACFFLNTIGGRAYLFRRTNKLRVLLTYYCVLIIDHMSKKGKNIYGVNIVPPAKRLKDELTRFPDLRFRSYYIIALDKILRE